MTTNLEFDLEIAEGFARTAKPTTEESEYRAACHPLKTDRCPSVLQLEKIAYGRRIMQQVLHVNICAYCQKSVAMLREMLEIKPWWQTLHETAQELGGAFQFAIPDCAGALGERSVGAQVVIALTTTLTTISVLDLEFVPGGLWVLLQWQQLMEEIRHLPMDLTVVGIGGQQIFGPYVLPGLSEGEKQNLLIALPPVLESEWKARIEATESLPFNFILRPCLVAEKYEEPHQSTGS